jgi:diguanylate cyclase (GGDEF) domain
MHFPSSDKFQKSLRSAYFFPVVISLLALVATFITSNTDYSFETKTAIFAGILAGYLTLTAFFYIRQDRIVKTSPAVVLDQETEEKLLALEEAGMFFGAALKPADMFRLLANRVNELVPFTTCVFYQKDETGARLKTAQAYGQKAESFEFLTIGKGKGLSGRVFLESRVLSDGSLTLERESLSPEISANFNSAVSVPLRSEGQTFGVLTLYGDRENAFGKRQMLLLEAAGERIAPLLLSSITFERNLENSLRDHLTELPNERALFLVLENQIAESQRYREQRPLTILSMDIKNFDRLNQKFGHAHGDRILNFTARMIKGQLRQMDFLSRVGGDEFLAVLPTASEEITRLIIERIEKAFEASPFEPAEGEKEFIKLNFGAASFLKDGETAQQLLKIARVRKKQFKEQSRTSLLWFSREYVN